jgi:hypothetical protein
VQLFAPAQSKDLQFAPHKFVILSGAKDLRLLLIGAIHQRLDFVPEGCAEPNP